MKTIDAINTLGIDKDQITLEDVKLYYRKASKAFHPDINPAGLQTMQAINEAYAVLQEEKFPIFKDENEKYSDYGAALNEALNKIMMLQNLNIQIVGAWIWVSGNTQDNKDALKSAGFLWSRGKKMWYFRPESQKKRYFRGNTSFEEIQAKYGSEHVYASYYKALA